MGRIDRDIVFRTLVTLAVALAGGLVGMLLGLPAGLLMGGAVASSILAFCGFRSEVPHGLRNIAFVLIGMTLGTNVSEDTLSLLPQWPVTIAGLALALVIIVFGTAPILMRVLGMSRGTAYLCSFPGHLSFVLGMAEAGYGDSRQIAIVQSFRVLVLTISVPLVARFVTDADLSSIGGSDPLAPTTLFMLAIACAAMGFLFTRIGIPAGYVLGSMAVAVSLKLAGLYHGTMPGPLAGTSLVIMGALIGSRFAGISRAEIRRALGGGVIVSITSIVTVTVIAYGCSLLVAMPFGQIWMGMAPGALEAMGALGIALGFDTAFIAAHHTVRLLMMSFVIPAVARFVGKVE